MAQEIRTLLPCVEHVEKLDEGAGSDVWLIQTPDHKYIFRAPKTLLPDPQFTRVLAVYQTTAALNMTPTLVSYDTTTQEMLLEYIDAVPWPSYTEAPLPYHMTMRRLSQFHKALRPEHPTHAELEIPFSWLSTEADALKDHADLPDAFFTAVRLLHDKYERLKPNLLPMATYCHGDLHRANVLLQQTGTDLTPFFIDFDSTGLGHPFFDVAKFTLPLTPEQRRTLFCEYLGQQEPSWEEEQQFELLHTSLLLLIATLRFKAAYASEDILLSKEAMEALLGKKAPLPSCLAIPFKDTSPGAKQISALCALQAALKIILQEQSD